MAALSDAVEAAGGEIRRERVTDPATLPARQVVIAAGAWSGKLGALPVRPVKGQIMRLRDPRGEDLVTRTIRTREGYLVPRGEGRYVLGATVEERGWDTAPTAGATHELIRDLAEVVPGVLELEIEELGAGLRPGTPDNLPVIGEAGGADLGDRPLPQRDPAGRRHRRGRGRGARGRGAAGVGRGVRPGALRGGRRMKVLVNGEQTELEAGATVESVLASLELPTAASRSPSTPRSSRAGSGARTS